MEGKVVAITGCTSGIGLVLAKTIAELKGTVIMLNRASSRADGAFATVSEIAERFGAPTPILIECDLSRFSSVKKAAETLAAHVDGGLDVLANNAGIMAFPDVPTVDGFDQQMAVNHLSGFLLTQRMMPFLERAAAQRGEARVVMTSSCARRLDPPWDNTLQAKYLSPGNGVGRLGGNEVPDMMKGGRYQRYQQTKLANVVFTQALHERLSASGSRVKALCNHPGVALTQLFANTTSADGVPELMKKVPPIVGRLIERLLFQSEEDGAMGLALCACSTEAVSGEFYGPLGKGADVSKHDQSAYKGPAVAIGRDPLANDAATAMLWELSEKATGGKFDLAVAPEVSQAPLTADAM